MGTSISPSQGSTMSARASTTPAPNDGCKGSALHFSMDIRTCIFSLGIILLTILITMVSLHEIKITQEDTILCQEVFGKI